MLSRSKCLLGNVLPLTAASVVPHGREVTERDVVGVVDVVEGEAGVVICYTYNIIYNLLVVVRALRLLNELLLDRRIPLRISCHEVEFLRALQRGISAWSHRRVEAHILLAALNVVLMRLLSGVVEHLHDVKVFLV